MRKLSIFTTLSIALLSIAGTIAFAGHGKEPAVDGMSTMDGMAGMEGMAAGEGAMPMQGMGMGMMPMMMGMMEKMPMMMGMMAMMPMGGQPAGAMAGIDTMAPAPAAAAAAVPAGLEAKLDLLITSIDSLTARIEKLEAPAAN